jgi:hypothetical protein
MWHVILGSIEASILEMIGWTQISLIYSEFIQVVCGY